MSRLQMPLERLAVTGDRKAENKIDEGDEQVGFGAEAPPGGIGHGRLGRLRQVEDADDDDQRGILEQGDENADQRRNDHLQRLRQYDFTHLLPIAQADGIRALVLALGYGLQTAAHRFGDVRRGKQDDGDLRTQELVDAEAFRQEQRQHDRRHEQQADQGHTAYELDVDDAQGLDGRHVRPPARRQEQAEGKREGNAEGAQDERQRPAAPAVALDIAEPEYPAPQQDRDGDQCHGRGQAQRGLPEPAYAAAYDDGDKKDAGQQGPPLFVVGIDAEQDQAVFFGDEGPAGAARSTALLRVGGVEIGPDEQPFDHGRNGHQQEPGDQHRKQGIERRRK